MAVNGARPRSAPAKTNRQSRTEPTPRPGLAVRQTAQRVLGAVIDTRTSLDGLTDDSHGHPQFRALDLRDRSLVKAMLATALRHRMTITKLIAEQLDRPLPGNAASLSHLLHVAAAQILFLDVPDHSAVDLAVECAKTDPRNRRFASLVNAVLRKLIGKKKDGLAAAMAVTLDAPDWLIERLQATYGKTRAAAILAMHRLPAPLDLTVKSDPEDWARLLNGIVLPNGTVRLESFDGKVAELAGYSQGEWWVQDVAASLPARLMGNIKGKRVADLCAAPGGKTAALIVAGADVTAVDVSASRLNRLETNLARLNLKARTVISNIMDYEPQDLFDAVLLDAPCSSTGTVRRHPDVAWTKTPADIEKLAALQLQLLRRSMSLVKPGGTVVFSNCSLDPLEGEAVVAKLLAEMPDAAVSPILPAEAPGFAHLISHDGLLRTTPADLVLERPEISGMDGFFAARFIRVS